MITFPKAASQKGSLVARHHRRRRQALSRAASIAASSDETSTGKLPRPMLLATRTECTYFGSPPLMTLFFSLFVCVSGGGGCLVFECFAWSRKGAQSQAMQAHRNTRQKAAKTTPTHRRLGLEQRCRQRAHVVVQHRGPLAGAPQARVHDAGLVHPKRQAATPQRRHILPRSRRRPRKLHSSSYPEASGGSSKGAEPGGGGDAAGESEGEGPPEDIEGGGEAEEPPACAWRRCCRCCSRRSSRASAATLICSAILEYLRGWAEAEAEAQVAAGAHLCTAGQWMRGAAHPAMFYAQASAPATPEAVQSRHPTAIDNTHTLHSHSHSPPPPPPPPPPTPQNNSPVAGEVIVDALPPPRPRRHEARVVASQRPGALPGACIG